MDKKKGILILAMGMILAGAIFFAYFQFFSEKKSQSSFEVDSVLIKTVVKQGEFSYTSLKITNFENESGFNIKATGLTELISLSEQKFNLKPLDSKEVKIYLNSSSHGIYAGSLVIQKREEEKIIPIILEVQTKEVFFVINSDINPTYKKINPGEELFTEINFFNLKDKNTHDIQVKYEIKNLKNEIIISETKTETLGSKTSFSKTFFISKKISPGNYVFTVFLEYKGFISTSGNLFSVAEKKEFLSFFNLDFFILIVAIVLLLTLFLLFYLFYERNKLFFKLKKQHANQLKVYSKRIDLKKKESLAEAKTEKGKKKILKEFKGAKERIIRELKKEQEKQKKKLEKLNTLKNEKFAEEKLTRWSRDAYSKAVKSAEISRKLKMKLGVLEHAYSEGYISEGAYAKGSSRIKSAAKKLKRKSL